MVHGEDGGAQHRAAALPWAPYLACPYWGHAAITRGCWLWQSFACPVLCGDLLCWGVWREVNLGLTLLLRASALSQAMVLFLWQQVTGR